MDTSDVRKAIQEFSIQKAFLPSNSVVGVIGDGTGEMACRLAPLVQKVYIICTSENIQKDLRTKLDSLRDQVNFWLLNDDTTILSKPGLEAFFSVQYLSRCPDPMEAIRTMSNYLKPGGKLVVIEPLNASQWLDPMQAEEGSFDCELVRSTLQESDLVNVITTSCEPDERLFIGIGTKRIEMQTAVRQVYDLVASGQSPTAKMPDLSWTRISSCCSGSLTQFSKGCDDPMMDQVNFVPGYTTEDKAAVPTEAAEFSLGCGNPNALASLSTGEVVLDIGSGGGMDVFLAASQVSKSGKVIGVDISPAATERATRSASAQGIENVEFRRGQAENLPVDDQSVDVVISNCVVNLCEDKGLVFQEAFRVLKLGGRLQLSDVVTSSPLSIEARQKAGDWSECITGALPEDEYLALITQAGFRVQSIHRSASPGEIDGAAIYSLSLSARKPDSSDQCLIIKYPFEGEVIDSVDLKALLVSRGVQVSGEVYEELKRTARLSKNPLECNSIQLPDGTVVQLTDLSFHMEYIQSVIHWDMVKQIRYLPQLITDFSLKFDAARCPCLYYKNQKITPVQFIPPSDFYKQKTSSGLPFLGNAVLQGTEWLSFQMLWQCDYACEGQPCQYCFSGGELASLAKKKKPLPGYPSPRDIADIVEYTFLKEKCAKSIQITGGSLFDDQAEVGIIVNILEAILRRVGSKNIPGEIVVYITPPRERESIDRIFNAGADRVSCSLEIWDEALARKIMPGKMKYTGRKRHLDCLEYIASRYGKNKACSNFIIGLEPLSSLLEGVEYLASHGIVPIASVWIPFGRPVMGSMKAPKLEYYQEFKRALSWIYKKYQIVPPGGSGLNVCICRDVYLETTRKTLSFSP